MAKQTQQAKILGLLVAAKGGWVSAAELSKISLQYSARVNELRERFRIENRVERVGRTKHGYFRLVTGSTPAPQSRSADVQESELFPGEARHIDLG